jgi:catechol 2,3-dioxygenase-like lactoylglutathione lyase family enzyme
MIRGGNATVYVSNMDTAIHFYADALGLKLTNRFGNAWATVQAGATLVIGLHPESPRHPRPAEANYIAFKDPDGNPIYVADREPGVDEKPAPREAVGSSAVRS